jgi:probable LLM family oxidoreductase
LELGIYSFVETAFDPGTGQPVEPARRMQDLLEEIELADRVGLDVYGIGEHHRSDFAASSPAVILAAAAARTYHIRLTSAVTVLSSLDPVRVSQDFATLDLISAGRAEIMVGRGSFIESFPLFGYDLTHYESLFEEHLDLLLKLRENERITWSGMHRPALDNIGVYPRPVQDRLPVWIGVGGTPESAIRAGTLGLPMALGIVGGGIERFKPLVDLYRRFGQQAGHDASHLAVGLNCNGHVVENSSRAADEAFPYLAAAMEKIGRERGWSRFTRAQFEEACGPRGALFVGTPNEIIEKILLQHRLFGHRRCLIYMGAGGMPHEMIMHAIELFGAKVAPAVRAALGTHAERPRDRELAGHWSAVRR